VRDFEIGHFHNRYSIAWDRL